MDPSTTPSSDPRVRVTPPPRWHHSLSIGGMTCAGCVGRVEKALTAVDGVTGAYVNLATDHASVTVQDRDLPEIVLVRAVENAGFTAKKTNGLLSDPDYHAHSDQQRLSWRFLITAALSLPFVVEMGFMFTSGQMLVTPVAQWALATPVLIIAGLQFLRPAKRLLQILTFRISTLRVSLRGRPRPQACQVLRDVGFHRGTRHARGVQETLDVPVAVACASCADASERKRAMTYAASRLRTVSPMRRTK